MECDPPKRRATVDAPVVLRSTSARRTCDVIDAVVDDDPDTLVFGLVLRDVLLGESLRHDGNSGGGTRDAGSTAGGVERSCSSGNGATADGRKTGWLAEGERVYFKAFAGRVVKQESADATCALSSQDDSSLVVDGDEGGGNGRQGAHGSPSASNLGSHEQGC